MTHPYALVFDFDGPIFNGRAIAEAALAETAQHFASQFAPPGVAFRDVALLNPPALIAALYTDAALTDADRQTIETYYRAALGRGEAKAAAQQGIKQAIQQMVARHIPLAIFSSSKAERVSRLLGRMGLQQWFPVIVGRDNVQNVKPAPDGLQLIAERLRLPAHCLVVIGDSDSDYEAARAAGCVYYHAAWTGEPASVAPYKADAVLRSAEQLLEVMHAAEKPLFVSAPVLPADLHEAAANGTFSFYAGAGISVPSGIGGWDDHYLPVLTKLNASLMAADMELEDVLQVLAAQDEQLVFDTFKASFADARVKPNAYHYAMLRSAAPNIWTSNYDHLFEHGNEVGASSRTVIRNDGELLSNFDAERSVIKMNGDFQGDAWGGQLRWGVAVLREHFDRADLDRREIWRQFEDDYRYNSMVMVGLSFSDSALRRIVSIQRRAIRRTRRTHYFVTRKPRGPLAERNAVLHAKNLERLQIATIFLDSHDDVLTFVKRTALASLRPLVAFSGSARRERKNAPALTDDDVLPGGTVSLAAIDAFCTAVGYELASGKHFRVASGGARGVGRPVVSAAFEAEPTLARFYLRQKGTDIFDRSAPSVIVRGNGLEDMRNRMVEDASALVVIGGGGGTEKELELALAAEIPVLLVPQSGGAAQRASAQFKQSVLKAYSDDRLASAVVAANEQIAAIPPEGLVEFGRQTLPDLIESVLMEYVGSTSPHQAPPRAW